MQNSTFFSVVGKALTYARLGYAVLPIKHGEKAPANSNGLRGASRDAELIRRWFVGRNLNVGILPPEGVLVLDVDEAARWPELLAAFPELESAPRQATPSGGYHVFVRLPEEAIGRLSASTNRLPGVDIRGMGRAYLVVEPSVVDGRGYCWERPLVAPADLPLIPVGLLARLLPAQHQSGGGSIAPVTTNAATRAQAERELQRALERVASAPNGRRHNTLLRNARLVGGLVSHGVDEEVAREALAQAGMAAGLPELEARQTARDGIEYGKNKPLPTDTNARGVATKLVQLALDSGVELWHDPEQNTWASLYSDGGRANWRLRSREFRHWLGLRFYEAEGRAPNAQAMLDALGVLEGRALFGGSTHQTHIRVAHADGAVWLDLGNPRWDVVRVGPDGWRVVAGVEGPRFRRSKSSRELPTPTPSRGINALSELLSWWNLSDAQQTLVIAWLLGGLSAGPYPVLALSGEQGSGKSTLARLLRGLLDPGGDLVSLPRDSRDLFVAARNSHVLAFDNVSGIPPWLSDDLCKLSTGGRLRVRELYSDDEEVHLEAKRPIILNGITDFITRQDLLDRAVILHLRPIEQYQPEGELWEAYHRLHAQALGELLELAALAMRELPRTQTPNVRMADFARWALAAESGYPAAGGFLEAYSEMRAEEGQAALDADPVYPPLVKLLEKRGGEFRGSASELLAALRAELGAPPPPDGFPHTAHGMGAWLKRMAPGLRGAGLEVAQLNRGGREGKRGWVIRHLALPTDISDGAADICSHLPEKQMSADKARPGRDLGQAADITDISDISTGAFSGVVVVSHPSHFFDSLESSRAQMSEMSAPPEKQRAGRKKSADISKKTKCQQMSEMSAPYRDPDPSGCPTHWLRVPELPPRGARVRMEDANGRGMLYRVKVKGVWWLIKFLPPFDGRLSIQPAGGEPRVVGGLEELEELEECAAILAARGGGV